MKFKIREMTGSKNTMVVDVYENDSENLIAIWHLSELKKIKEPKILKTAKELKSFNEAKNWVLQNHPELLI
jgi:hypothetical protein